MNNFGNTTNGMFQPYYKGNKIFVTSLEEALARTNEFNSDMIYLHQSENIAYSITVDAVGRKSYSVAKLVPQTPAQNQQAQAVSSDELQALRKEIEEIKKHLNIGENNG